MQGNLSGSLPRFAARSYWEAEPAGTRLRPFCAHLIPAAGCYYGRMFNFGKPKTAGDWIVHIAGAIVAILLIWWMLRMYVL
jgi:hypothetical protein